MMDTDRILIGIDSGSEGGMCARSVSGDGIIVAAPIPWRWEKQKYAKALLDVPVIEEWYGRVRNALGRPAMVMIETPQLRAGGPGKMVNSLESVSSSWWQAGQIDLFFRMQIPGVEIEYCSPQQWQRLILWTYLHDVRGIAYPRREGNKNILAPGWPKGNEEWKEISISYVHYRFGKRLSLIPPRCRVPHDGMADSVGVAGYGAEVLRGLLHERLWISISARKMKKGRK